MLEDAIVKELLVDRSQLVSELCLKVLDDLGIALHMRSFI